MNLLVLMHDNVNVVFAPVYPVRHTRRVPESRARAWTGVIPSTRYVEASLAPLGFSGALSHSEEASLAHTFVYCITPSEHLQINTVQYQREW